MNKTNRKAGQRKKNEGKRKKEKARKREKKKEKEEKDRKRKKKKEKDGKGRKKKKKEEEGKIKRKSCRRKESGRGATGFRELPRSLFIVIPAREAQRLPKLCLKNRTPSRSGPAGGYLRESTIFEVFLGPKCFSH